MQHLRNQNHIMLELDKILALLADCAGMNDAKELCLSLEPSSNIETVKSRLAETDEAYIMIAKYGAPSFGGAKNVGGPLARAEAGSVLSIKELLNIGETLRIIRSVKEWRGHFGGESLPETDKYFETLTPCKYFEEKILSSIKNEEELFDEASPTLSDIRRKIRSNALNVRDRLDRMIKGGATARYLQDAIVTQRDGRFVVPVKVEHRAQVPGLVHDTSSSGATVFIEPMAVVELNNEIKILYSKEADEIERILAELSADAAGICESVKRSYKALVHINFIFAKADLAFKMKASTPEVNTAGKVFLKNARHPLIHKNRVVPITASLGLDFDTLIITGPNTGGKTVTIKTIGLLTLMAMCGLMIPCDDGSRVSVFRHVLADIGDEQSIEQSLSTFSAHMTNIVSILNKADSKSLVLIDELGSGTDPVEGAALATAVLTQLRRGGALIAATTHYAELKTFALNTEGVCNASCEFDVETLSPTYRLIIGTPGRSNAFAISKRLGLAESIITEAEGLISKDNRQFEETLSALDKARQEAEAERRQAEKIRIELELEKQKNKQRTENMNVSRERLMERAREEARAVVDKARAEANRLIDELEAIKKSEANNAADRIARARAAAKSGLSKLEDISDPIVNKEEEEYSLPRPLQMGDEVEISTIGKRASVLQLDEKSKQALVLAGSMKMRVPYDNLRLLKKSSKPEVPKTRKVSSNINRAERKGALEIDLRGMASDEAILELDRFIDNALLSNMGQISIIHGKGTGVLRKAVQDYLRHHRSVVRFRLGVFGEGESGVTIAELK